MSGGVVGARAGTLTFMLGAPTAIVPRARTVLSLLGARVFHLGQQGTGLAGKLANNYLLAVTIAPSFWRWEIPDILHR